MKKSTLKKSIPTAFALLLSITISSCGNKDKVEIENPFSSEGEYNLEIIRTKDDYQANRKGDYNTVTDVNFKIAEASASQVKAVLQYGKTTVEGNRASEITPDQMQMINVWEGLTIPLTIENGEIKLDDYMKAFSDVEARFETIYGIDTLSKENEMYTQFKTRFREMAKDEKSILTNFIPEIPLFFNTINKEYNNGAVSTNDSIQSPYGNGFLKVVSKVSIFPEDEFTEVVERDTISDDDILEARQMLIQQYQGNPQVDPNQLQNIPMFKYIAEKSIILGEDGQIETIEQIKTFDNGMQKQSDIVKLKFNSKM